MNVWMQFAICVTVILYAGTQISRQAELIAEKSKLSKSWVSFVLLSMVTCLPQLVAGISSVTLHDLPDMAVSGIIGSCMVNMMVIGLLDPLSKNRPVSYIVHQGHLLAAGFGIVLMGLAAVDILFGKHLPIIYWLHYMDPITVAFVVGFLIAMRLIFKFEQTRSEQLPKEHLSPEAQNLSWLKILLPFLFNAACIVAAGIYLPEIGEEIGKSTGWGQSFIGSSFIAITTSLPEFAVAMSAARRGAFDMAVANLMGSTLFNIVILGITDFSYTKGPLLHNASITNVLAALTAIISMGIVVIGLTYRSKTKLRILSGDAVALIAVYILANVLLFVAR